MGAAVAYQHTDGNRNYDGSHKLHGIKKVGTDRKSVGPQFYYVTQKAKQARIVQA